MSSSVLCVIMGGGRGTRLEPLTRLRAKPAVPLAGKYRLVDIAISNCLNSGLNRIFLLTQFNTESLHRHVHDSYRFDSFGGGFVDILSAEQTSERSDWYQGTADAVRQNLKHFPSREDDRFLILSGDQLYRMDFRAMLAQHERTRADVTIATKPLPINEVEGLGVLRLDDDLVVTDFVEKPTERAVLERLSMLPPGFEERGTSKLCFANMGIYVFNRSTLVSALEAPGKSDFSKEVIPALMAKARVFGFVYTGYWQDIGTVRNFFETNLRLADPDPPFDFFHPRRTVYTHMRYLPSSRISNCRVDRAIVADGCSIEDAVLDRCVVGVRSRINAGSMLQNVVMMGQDEFESPADRTRNRTLGRPDMGLGARCLVRNAIIDKNARIGNDVRLSPEGLPDTWEQGDVFVRDGVLIVLKNGTIPDGTVIGSGFEEWASEREAR